jgi:cytochrome c556
MVAFSSGGNSMPTLFRASLFAALGVAALALAMDSSTTVAAQKADKIPDIKTIMQEGHKGTDAFIARIGKEAKAGKWDDAQEHAKALAVFGTALGKNKPPMGDEASWKKLTSQYEANTKAVLAATEKKDAAGTAKSLKAITGSCGACHKGHKGK